MDEYMTGKRGVHSTRPVQLRRSLDAQGLPGAGWSAAQRKIEGIRFERWREAGVRRGWLTFTCRSLRTTHAERDAGGARAAAVMAAAVGYSVLYPLCQNPFRGLA